MVEAEATDRAGEIEYNEETFYSALNHDFRRRIIKLVGNSRGEFATFSQIKEELQASTGTVYHHLEVLKPLLQQDQKKRYHLTTLGKYAFNIMAHNVFEIETSKPKPVRGEMPTWEYLLKHLPVRLLQYHNGRPTMGWVVTGTCGFVLALFCAIFGFNSSFLFFFPVGDQASLSTALKVWLFFRFWLSFLAFSGLIQLMCRYVFKTPENFPYLLSSMGFVFFPLLFYFLVRQTSVLWMPAGLFLVVDKVALIGLQVVSILLLSTSLRVFKYLKMEQALIVVLLVHYFSFLVILLEVL
ncbi:MAG: ArsR family transcriptional regulator [Promethearchaeota archaeon]